MPVVWTKMFGKGRVYYNSLGHQANIVSIPAVLELIRRGFLWAAA
jgi:type 1 glutamine amidotransferase